MKHILPVGFAFALLSSAFAACTMDFDQFQPGPGGAGGSGGAGGNCAAECCAPTDCPQPAEPCMQATCNAGSCGEAPRADGTEAGTQTAGDCKKVVCQGGMPSTVADGMDPLDDGNDCTTDTCDGDTPASEPVAAGTACTTNNGKLCDGDGACVGCLMDMDCPPEAPNCDNAVCVSAQCGDGDENGDETDVDCGGSCPPCKTGQDCDDGADCESGVCSGGGANKKCAAPTCSDGVQNGAESDVDCGADCPNQCGPGEKCNEDNDCEGDECTGQGGTCVANCNDEVKNNAETDVDCGGGTCDPCAVGQDCAGVDSNCESGNCGAGDVCALAEIGSACGADGDCVSGQCADGVCCNANCGAVCQACNLAGSVGTCTSIPTGTDPANECAGAAVCNGMGACAKAVAQTCANDGECLSGFCTDGVCCNVDCAGTCESCNLAGTVGTCTNVPAGMDPNNECNGANMQNCNGMGMCGP